MYLQVCTQWIFSPLDAILVVTKVEVEYCVLEKSGAIEKWICFQYRERPGLDKRKFELW